MLPHKSGLEILAELRNAKPTLPVIILSARGEKSDRVNGLRLGADDYVAKPFSVDELLARVDAVLRRSPSRPSDIRILPLACGEVDFDRCEIRFTGGERLEISERERELLRYLARHAGRAISREELLTTFRMYSDMLACNMVPDAERRQEYLETLNLESQRFSHLVENVLSYARLERGRGVSSHEQSTVGEILDRLKARLTDRAAQAEMELQIDLSEAVANRQLTTDVSVVEQILFNLVDNASKYAARAQDRRIHCKVEDAGGKIRFVVLDHGPGFDKGRASTHPQPFSKSSEEAAVTAPGVGLGLALCGRLAKQLGGKLEIDSRSEGAAVTLELPLSRVS